MSTPQHFKWFEPAMRYKHFYKSTERGVLHVNTSTGTVNILQGKVPGLAAPCEPEDFNSAITKVWEQFNAIQ